MLVLLPRVQPRWRTPRLTKLSLRYPALAAKYSAPPNGSEGRDHDQTNGIAAQAEQNSTSEHALQGPKGGFKTGERSRTWDRYDPPLKYQSHLLAENDDGSDSARGPLNALYFAPKNHKSSSSGDTLPIQNGRTYRSNLKSTEYDAHYGVADGEHNYTASELNFYTAMSAGPKPRQYKDKTYDNPLKAELPSLSKSAKKSISVLEALAPAMSGWKRFETAASEREIPQQSFEGLLDSNTTHDQSVSNDAGSQLEQTGEQPQQRPQQYAISAVLVLRNAGKHLIEEDFRRLVPSDRHIAGWKEAYNLVRVIRGRQRHTLEPNGDYLILFRSAEAAEAYRTRVQRLHRLAWKWSRQSSAMDGAIGPPPVPPSRDEDEYLLSDIYMDSASWEETKSVEKAQRQGQTETEALDEDNPTDMAGTPPLAHRKDESPERLLQPTYEALESYTIYLPWHKLDLRTVQNPFNPLVASILEHGGYEPLMTGRKSPWEVLINIDGTQATIQEIRDAILADEQASGSEWDIVSRMQGIRSLMVPRESGGLEAWESNEYEAENSAPSETGNNTNTNADLDRRPPERQSRRMKRCFIVSFGTKIEAQRFINSFHRRDILDTLGDDAFERIKTKAGQSLQEMEMIVNADLIW